jgi:hypothetical protein
MNISEADLWTLCKKEGQAQDIDPFLLIALCRQEARRTREGLYVCDSIRLEQGFFYKYIDKGNYDPVTKVILSSSWGVMQMMGESLRELGALPSEEYHSTTFILGYCINPGLQIETGCKWIKKKIDLAHGSIEKGLLYWNGGSNVAYPSSVLKHRFEATQLYSI